MPRCRNMQKQFERPIVHMDREGNGYCRIREFWDEMSCKSYLEEQEESTPVSKDPIKAYVAEEVLLQPSQMPGNTIKFGAWSKAEHKRVRELINAGITDIEELARLMNRSAAGVRKVANYMIRKYRRKVG